MNPLDEALKHSFEAGKLAERSAWRGKGCTYQADDKELSNTLMLVAQSFLTSFRKDY